MCARIDLHLGNTVNGGHLYSSAQRGSRKAEKEIEDYVVLVANQVGILLLLDNDEQVAVYPSSAGGIALARHGELHPLGHTGRDADGDHLFLAHNTLTVTVGTFLGDRLSLTVTGGAGG